MESPSSPPTPTEKVKISLSGVQETLMLPLYARYQDAQTPNPILNDKWAAVILDRVDYDVRRAQSDFALSTVMLLRARQLDAWTADFLRRHEGNATVLHLACGLDSRHLRLDWARRPGVRWIDVDFPEVIALRERLYADARPGAGMQGGCEYRMLAASVTDESWLDEVPADRPVVVVMEGLIMYLELDEGKRLIQRVRERFPSGEVVFDTSGYILVLFRSWMRPVHGMGAKVQCCLDNPRELEKLGLKLRDSLGMINLPGIERFPAALKFALWAQSWIPYVKTMVQYLRYSF